MSEEILKRVQGILYPKIGKIAADSAIRINCQRMGIQPEDLSKENLAVFSENLKVSLILFLEDKEVESIIEEIKKL